jgi:hypothetical protein
LPPFLPGLIDEELLLNFARQLDFLSVIDAGHATDGIQVVIDSVFIQPGSAGPWL